MSRVPDLAPAEMTADQRRIHDEIAAKRHGHVRGPFAIWLRAPTIADRANQFGNAIRVAGKLDKRLFELMVLIVARHWSAQYEWFAHADQALANGVAPDVVEAIRHGQRPKFTRADEELVYDLVDELNQRKVLSQKSYDRGIGHFGLELFIELVTAIGFYTMVAMTLNAFDAPVPGGARPLP